MIRKLLQFIAHSPSNAEEWVARIQSAELGSREQRALARWLSASPRNAEEFASCNKIGYLANSLKGEPELVRALPAYAALKRAEPEKRAVVNRAMWRLGALGAIASVVLAILFLPDGSLSGAHGVIATTHGEQLLVPLQDGSKITANTDTRLIVSFSDAERRIDLKRGEAFFDVAKNANRPFIVRVGNNEVRAVGTKFSVRWDESHVDVVVAEGKVRVVPVAYTDDNRIMRKSIDLLPGNELVLDTALEQAKITAVNADHATAWRSGSIEFDSEALADVIAEINRYSRKKFVIEDDGLKSIRISGRFSIGDIESVRFGLMNGISIETEMQGNNILLRSAR